MINKQLLIILSFTSLLFVILPSYSITQSYAQNTWQHETLFTSIEKTYLYNQPADDAEVIDSLSFLTKLVVIRSVYDSHGVGWKKCIYPVNGFVKSKFLVSKDAPNIADADLNKQIKIKTAYESWHVSETYSETDYAFVKASPDYRSENAGIIKDGEKVLFITDGKNENGLWIKTIYPFEGYILSTDFSISGIPSALSVALSYGIVNIPYEKNLSNDFNPIGGMIEYFIPGWNLGIRAGYSYSQSHLNEYTLKTHLAYLQFRYSFLTLFENHLEAYAAAGGGYWFSSFQNLKYDNINNYFTEEKDKDLAYTLSAGAIYKLYNFFIDAQYFFVGTREGKFGKEPAPGEFTNLYKLYPAANHINVFVGYTFRF